MTFGSVFARASSMRACCSPAPRAEHSISVAYSVCAPKHRGDTACCTNMVSANSDATPLAAQTSSRGLRSQHLQGSAANQLLIIDNFAQSAPGCCLLFPRSCAPGCSSLALAAMASVDTNMALAAIFSPMPEGSCTVFDRFPGVPGGLKMINNLKSLYLHQAGYKIGSV